MNATVDNLIEQFVLIASSNVLTGVILWFSRKLAAQKSVLNMFSIIPATEQSMIVNLTKVLQNDLRYISRNKGAATMFNILSKNIT